MNDLFTPAEALTVARIELKARRYEHQLLKQAAKAGRIPSARTLITRSMDKAFQKAFAEPQRDSRGTGKSRWRAS